MRTKHLQYLIAMFALLAQCCGLHAGGPAVKVSAENLASDLAYTNLMVGTWQEDNVRIELRTDGGYESWAPYLQSDLAAKTMLQSGQWSVHGRTFSLRIDKSFVGHVPPGTTLTYEIISLSSERALLASPAEKREITWTKVSAHAEPFWKGALSYEPPFKMSSYLHPADAGTAVGDWELFSTAMEAGTNGPAEVVFHLGTVAEFIGTDRPAKALETVADLKAFMDSELKASPPGGRPLLSLVNVGGREALMSIPPTNQVPGQPIKWRGAVCFFWEVNSTICSITMTAETGETFNLLTNSLKTIKLLRGKQKN